MQISSKLIREKRSWSSPEGRRRVGNFQKLEICQVQGFTESMYVEIFCRFAFCRKLGLYSKHVLNFAALSLQIRTQERVKLGGFSASKGQTCKNWENPGWLVELVFWRSKSLFLGWFQLRFGWVGAGNPLKSEAVRHFFAPFSHISASISKTTRPIWKMLVPFYFSLQGLPHAHTVLQIWLFSIFMTLTVLDLRFWRSFENFILL